MDVQHMRVDEVNPSRIIAENTPGCDEWRDSSFLGMLHEFNKWDFDEYWKIEKSLYETFDSEARPSDGAVFRIFSHVMLLFSCHFDADDVFAISNLDAEEIAEVRERAQMVFEGYFKRLMPDSSCFDRTNPLISPLP